MTHLPLPLFDAGKYHQESLINPDWYPVFHPDDFNQAKRFLGCYLGSKGTFNAYRREVERLLSWAWLVCEKKVNQLTREDVESFIHFCQTPPESWIGTDKPTRFISKSGERLPNKKWKPFVVTIPKSAHRKGQSPKKHDYELSDSAIKDIFAILSSFFNYLLQEEYVFVNPVALIRQKSQFIRKHQQHQQIRRLTDYQWQTLFQSTKKLAEQYPKEHERSLFVLTALYSMYLRISELVADDRWMPQMNHFKRDADNNWWFHVVGKGNKARQIAVSDTMLAALKRWRTYLGLSALPVANDNKPLLPKLRGKGPLTNSTHLRTIIQTCFDAAMLVMKSEGQHEEADAMLAVTVHWLRHTGISEDVKHRPREHVRDDAGHSSSATTDKYIDIELKARHQSAKEKTISGQHQTERSNDDN